jgi:hypothetical protein
MMKITKQQCTPTNKNKGRAPLEEIILRRNKYIPESKKKPEDDDDATSSSDNDDDIGATNGGRELKYLPIIVYTPVLTSKRTPDNRRLLDDKDVEELNQKLATLLLDSNKQEGKEDDDENNLINSNEKELACLFGRISNTVFSYKTCKSSQVMRSARFAPVAQA